MAEHDEKVLLAATRLDVQAAAAVLRREACLQEADSKVRQGTKLEHATPQELGKLSEQFLVAKYQTKGRKQRQEELLPELQSEDF